MRHYSGGKFVGHTTYTDLAGRVADIAHRLDQVTRISPGFIQHGAGTAGGIQRVLLRLQRGCLLVTVRQSRSVQELRIFGSDLSVAALALARALRNEDVRIAFRA